MRLLLVAVLLVSVAPANWLAPGGRVLSCEKGRVAAERSSRNRGWIRQVGRDPAEQPVMMESSRMRAALAVPHDVDIGSRQQVIIYPGLLPIWFATKIPDMIYGVFVSTASPMVRPAIRARGDRRPAVRPTVGKTRYNPKHQ